MITSIANLLRELMVIETAKLDTETITHPPTIGAMYEGLTRNVLDRAIPASLDLRIVNGFIERVDGGLSPQIDAMLVRGEGRELPYGVGHVWPIRDVISVVEVKKISSAPIWKMLSSSCGPSHACRTPMCKVLPSQNLMPVLPSTHSHD